MDNDQIEFEIQTPVTPGTAAAEPREEALQADYEYFCFRFHAFSLRSSFGTYEFGILALNPKKIND